MRDKVALIGFGEAGQTFAEAGGWGQRARAFDRLTDDPATQPAKQRDYERLGVAGQPTLAAAIAGAELALSLVTAGQAGFAAEAAARSIASGCLYCDMNSVAPTTKRAAAAVVEAAGAEYVDVAVMAPVQPGRLDVPLLLSGAAAVRAAAALAALGFTSVRVVGSSVGEASAIKMIRSVMVKGIEALTAECMLAAELAGVTQEVLASLDQSERSLPWAERADYNLDRMLAHGIRRSEEMKEVVRTLQQLGVEPLMAHATAERQRRVGKVGAGRPRVGLAGKLAQIVGRDRANAA
jgi:3-hydroxyisobutyrate dehydrogenase-like beta-hydroxyacid dehydrogenase